MEEDSEKKEFSPILIMEFIRQVTVARCLMAKTTDTEVKFRLVKTCYDEIMAYPLKAQLLWLELSYDANTEVLSVKADKVLIERFREQKSLVEIAGKYEAQYSDRYRNFVEVIG